MPNQTIELDGAEARGGDLVRISVVSGPHKGLRWVFDAATEVSIGRDAKSNLVFSREAAFSRVHLVLNIEPPQAELIDQSSRNGTLVNGVRVAQATLQNGDRFGIGETELLYEAIPANKNADQFPVQKRLTKDTTESIPPKENQVRRVQSQNSIEQTRVGATGRKNAANTKGREREQAPTVHPSGKASGGDDASFSVTEEFVPATKPHRPEVGSTIGSYEIESLLGAGGMANVFRARHRRSNEVVALKLIRSDVEHTEKQIQLFVREAATVTKLTHPRIVRATEFGVDGKTPFLVMEYIDGFDLLQLIDQSPDEQKLKTSVWVIKRVLQALHYLHQNGIVHRDVKPGNILAYKEKHRLHVKLADFGLAKLYEDAGYSGLTSDGSVRGTIAYMSPEHFHHSKLCGPRDDLFSCGACLYRFVTGELPNMVFRPEETIETLRQASVPEQVRNVIESSIHRDLNNRFESAIDFTLALDQL